MWHPMSPTTWSMRGVNSIRRRSRMKPILVLVILFVSVSWGDEISAQTVANLRLFEQHCTNCHGNPAGPKGALDGLKLRQMAPEAIYAALGRAPHANVPSDQEKRAIAEYLGGRKIG